MVSFVKPAIANYDGKHHSKTVGNSKGQRSSVFLAWVLGTFDV
jgi:hypothetical protein